MSLDKSLKSNAMLERHRNVLSRAERIDKLKEHGTWSDDRRPLGLPKVGHRKAAIGKKDKAEKKVEGETPVAGAAPAAGDKKPAGDKKAGGDKKAAGDKKG